MKANPNESINRRLQHYYLLDSLFYLFVLFIVFFNPYLHFTVEEKLPFHAFLKEDRDFWRNCLLEIQAGHQIAEGVWLFHRSVPIGRWLPLLTL